METTWDLIKSLYVKYFNMPETIVDFIAVHDILELCCRGWSVFSIASRFNFEEEYIKDVIKQFFNFPGFETDLDVDTRRIYLRHPYNKYVFVSVCRDTTPFLANEETCKLLYTINNKLDKIEKGIDNYYAKH